MTTATDMNFRKAQEVWRRNDYTAAKKAANKALNEYIRCIKKLEEMGILDEEIRKDRYLFRYHAEEIDGLLSK